jgi:hypothetical protein
VTFRGRQRDVSRYRAGCQLVEEEEEEMVVEER